MKALKPWLSFEEQLILLRTRGLDIDNSDAALDYLERLGYYRLSGYWYSLRETDDATSQAQRSPVRRDRFIPGSRFEHVVQLYVFDKKLRLLALDALERIEMAVRVDIAYRLGQRNPRAHEDPKCFHGNFSKKLIVSGPNRGKTQHQVWLDKFQALRRRARREPFVDHHTQNYGCLPIWVAIEIWDFGLLSKLFAGMKHGDKDQIARIYGAPNGKTFAQWLRSLNFIRNVSAHHSRLWNINILERSPIPSSWPTELSNARPFFYFCLLQQLLSAICPNSTWWHRLIALMENEFPKFPDDLLSVNDMGLIAGWECCPEWNI